MFLQIYCFLQLNEYNIHNESNIMYDSTSVIAVLLLIKWSHRRSLYVTVDDNYMWHTVTGNATSSHTGHSGKLPHRRCDKILELDKYKIFFCLLAEIIDFSNHQGVFTPLYISSFYLVILHLLFIYLLYITRSYIYKMILLFLLD